MLDRFTHTNSNNEVLDFFEYGIFANYNDLRDYEWRVETNNNLITSLKRAVKTKKIPFVFMVEESKADEIKNAFYEHFDYDTLTGQLGYFTINGYKYYGYVTKSLKTDYLRLNGYLKITLEFTSDKPYWIKETVYPIDFANVETTSEALKYPFTYSFTYSRANAIIVNGFFVPCDGIVRVFGYAVNPIVKINDNIYQVNTTLEIGEFLEIDTEDKTIFKYSITGEKTNLFNYRNKDYDVFKPIPSGSLTINANSTFKIDLVIFEKRSEPKWNSSTPTRNLENLVTYPMSI